MGQILRGFGYVISIIIIIASVVLLPFTVGISAVGIIMGIVFIWMLKKEASGERIEKHLRHMDPMHTTEKNLEDMEDYKQALDKEYKAKVYDLEHNFKKRNKILEYSEEGEKKEEDKGAV